VSMLAEATPTPRRSTRVYRRPTWWTVRPLDGARYEVALFQQGCPLNWHVVSTPVRFDPVIAKLA